MEITAEDAEDAENAEEGFRKQEMRTGVHATGELFFIRVIRIPAANILRQI